MEFPYLTMIFFLINFADVTGYYSARVAIRNILGIDMLTRVIPGLLLISVLSCSSALIKNSFERENVDILTERELWRMHKDVRFASFIYDDRSEIEGLLLRWQPDSILIQPRGADQPIRIPSSGIIGIRIETGNRILESLILGTVAAAAYVGSVKSYDLGETSATEAMTKLLGPPLIIFGAIAVGSSMEKYRLYRVPEGFEFDYEEANSLYELLE